MYSSTIVTNPALRGMMEAREANERSDARTLALAQGLLGLQNLLQQREQNRLLMPLQLKQLEGKVAEAEQMRTLRGGLMSLLNPQTVPATGGGLATLLPPTGPGMASAPTGGSPTLSAPANPSGSHLPARIQLAIMSGDPGLKAWGQEQAKFYEPRTVAEGGGVFVPGQGFIGVRPKVGEGMQATGYGPTGELQGVRVIPGYAEGQQAIREADERARAGYDIVTVPDGRGGTARMSRLQALNALTPGQVEQPALADPLAPLMTGRPPAEQAAIRAVHAAGNAPMSVTVPAGPGLAPVGAPLGFGRTKSEAEQAADRERAIAGAKRESEAPQAGLQTGTQLDSFDRLLAMSNQVLNTPGLSRAVGLYGAFPNVPGQSGADAQALIDSLKAQVSAMKLQAMRDASKTGGAVGNVTEKEWPRLEAMVTALDARQSPAQFRQQVGQLVQEIRVSRRRVADAYQQEFGNTPGAQAPRSRADILRQYGAE